MDRTHAYLWLIGMLQDSHGSVRRFAISLLSVSAMGTYFVPIGKVGRLALLQLDQNIVRLRNTIDWQDSCTVTST